MELEFIFNGVSCTEMGLTYIPSRKNVTPNLAPVKVIDAEPTYRHGGYYFGHQVQPREFNLECFAEEIERDRLEDILLWMAPGNEGTLVFTDRPLVHYDVIVISAPDAEAYWDGQDPWSTITCKLNFTVKAYDPFGKLDVISSDGTEEQERARQYSGLIPSSMMPSNTYTNMGTFLVYNPGSYESNTVIRVAGTVSEYGLTVWNKTNNDRCKFVELPSGSTTPPDYLEVKSDPGTVQWLPTYPDAMSYAYHDEGYIRLVPSLPRKNVTIYKTAQENTVTSSVPLSKADEGKYVYLEDKWWRISQVTSSTTAVITLPTDASQRVTQGDSETTVIATMNEIEISGSGATLSRFDLTYTPLVR